MKQYGELLEAMRSKYREETGFEVDDASDIGIRFQVLATVMAELYQQAEELRAQIFPQTSSGKGLELHAATRGIARKPALHAKGVLRFCREVPSANDIAVEEGVLCSTRWENPVHFVTTGSGILPAGALYLDVPARAVEPGSRGNAAPDAVCLLVSTVAGISGAGNPQAFTGGVDQEGDEELKRRLLHSYENISNTTNKAFYYDLAMGMEGVSSAHVLPRRRGRGTVDVVISGFAQEGEAELVEQLRKSLEEAKEINVDVQVTAAVREKLDLAVEIAVEEGYRFDDVSRTCLDTLANGLNGMEVGETLLLARINSALFGTQGVGNCRILKPAGDVVPPEDHVIRCGEVAVGRMLGGH